MARRLGEARGQGPRCHERHGVDLSTHAGVEIAKPQDRGFPVHHTLIWNLTRTGRLRMANAWPGPRLVRLFNVVNLQLPRHRNSWMNLTSPKAQIVVDPQGHPDFHPRSSGCSTAFGRLWLWIPGPAYPEKAPFKRGLIDLRTFRSSREVPKRRAGRALGIDTSRLAGMPDECCRFRSVLARFRQMESGYISRFRVAPATILFGRPFSTSRSFCRRISPDCNASHLLRQLKGRLAAANRPAFSATGPCAAVSFDG